MTNTPRGGARPGAGRPNGTSKPDSLRAMIVARLSPAEREKAAELGDGKIGRGLRRALIACQRRGKAPADTDDARIQTGVKLTDSERDKARRIGQGNASEGLRRALAAWAD